MARPKWRPFLNPAKKPLNVYNLILGRSELERMRARPDVLQVSVAWPTISLVHGGEGSTVIGQRRRARKPGYDCEKHLGGAYYLFLRGIEPARPEFGVHRMKLRADFVEKLSTVFTP